MWSEGLRPAAGRQLFDEALRVGGHAEQDILEVRERRHVDQFAALDERIEQGGATGALETARE